MRFAPLITLFLSHVCIAIGVHAWFTAQYAFAAFFAAAAAATFVVNAFIVIVATEK